MSGTIVEMNPWISWTSFSRPSAMSLRVMAWAANSEERGTRSSASAPAIRDRRAPASRVRPEAEWPSRRCPPPPARRPATVRERCGCAWAGLCRVISSSSCAGVRSVSCREREEFPPEFEWSRPDSRARERRTGAPAVRNRGRRGAGRERGRHSTPRRCRAPTRCLLEFSREHSLTRWNTERYSARNERDGAVWTVAGGRLRALIGGSFSRHARRGHGRAQRRVSGASAERCRAC